jgi:hypothetical protein
MEGPQVKIGLLELNAALKSEECDKLIRNLVKKGLQDMAERHQIPVLITAPLVSEVFDKVKEETLRFNPKMPFPPVTANNMSIQVVLPVRGAVGICEYNSRVEV